MAYITGNISTYASRLHEFCTGLSEFSSYTLEGQSYLVSGTGIVLPQTSGKWEKELRLRRYGITPSGIYLNSQVL